MCGIAGIWGNVSDDRLARMSAAVAHRGPDDQATWRSQSCSFGVAHRRLSIIDLQHGRQPISNEDNSIQVVFNGAIYNYKELRETLAAHGHALATHTDTETLVHLYEEHGTALVDHLRGMFAFAIWDDRRHELILARDRIGKRPLYYADTGNEFLFASEMKALVAVLGGLQIDLQALSDYLGWGCVPQPGTIYKSVRSIMPGEVVVVRDARVHERRRYWSPPPQADSLVSQSDAVEETESLLTEAVSLRLRADVPVACFLSGGIDSGLIAAIAARLCGSRLKTITVGFSDRSFDERPAARRVATALDTEHLEIEITPDVATDLPKIAAAYDQPYADSSAIPSYYVAHEASKHCKVALNGDGGDELFAGYRRYVAARFADKLSWLTNVLGHHAWEALAAVLPRPRGFRTGYAFAHRFLRGMQHPEAERYITWVTGGLTHEDLCRLGAGALVGETWPPHRILDHAVSGATHLQRMLRADLTTELPFDLLVKMDIACMAHGLEARSPLLDQRVVEHAAKLPPGVKLNGMTTKPILRALARAYLPAGISDAPKRGFEVPLVRWLREDLSDQCHDVVLARNGLLSELFQRSRLEDLLANRHRRDPATWSRWLWIVFMLGMWDQSVRRCMTPTRLPCSPIVAAI